MLFKGYIGLLGITDSVGLAIVTFQAPLSPEIIHFSIVDATVPFEVPFALPTVLSNEEWPLGIALHK
jgi:hypothetical protein